jgi:signal transduction histidine kinase/FixJ family two-component response regulator
MLPDTLTFIIFAVLQISFLGCLQIWLWRRDRALVVLAIWGVAHLFGAVGLMLIAGRALIPVRISIDLANALVFLGYGLAWIGARRLERQPGYLAVAIAGAVIWLALCQIPAFYDGLSTRIAGGAVIAAVYDAMTMREFLRRRTGVAPPSRQALAVTFGIFGLLQLARFIVGAVLGFGPGTFSLPASPWLALTALGGTVLAAGTSVLLIAVAKEEAEQRAIATLALARDTADRANIAKSRFLARMSHELRTPLNGVLGMAQALTSDASLGGEHRERVVQLEQAGRHLLAIVNDLLDLARVEAGRFQLSPQPCRVSEVIRGSADLVADAAVEKGVTLHVALAADSPPSVLADPVRVRQILVNLLGNAIKFTPPGGEVTLTVARLAAGGGLQLSVADTGPGVPPEILPRLFQDFVQSPFTEATSAEGTGLGLAISTTLAQAMGGTIGYRPGSNGVGSVFTVELPLPGVEPPSEAAAPPRPAPRPRPGVRVLVVDDVPSNRRVAQVFLQQAGFIVDVAASGALALAAMERSPLPDIVLMDVYMPGMDGLLATRRIRALPGPAGQVPIVALTADVSLEQAQACREAGMNGFVTKPLDFGELLATIAAAVPGAEVAVPANRPAARTDAVRTDAGR